MDVIKIERERWT